MLRSSSSDPSNPLVGDRAVLPVFGVHLNRERAGEEFPT